MFKVANYLISFNYLLCPYTLFFNFSFCSYALFFYSIGIDSIIFSSSFFLTSASISIPFNFGLKYYVHLNCIAHIVHRHVLFVYYFIVCVVIINVLYVIGMVYTV